MKRQHKGKVVSAGQNKTVSIEVSRKKLHPIYRKQYSISRKFLAHDEIGLSIGDIALIEETRPISKNKKWIVVSKLNEKEEA